MKKVLVTFLVLCLIIPLCACAQKIEPARVNSLEYRTTKELEEIEGVENFSDETIKAMSVIIRTNLSKEVDSNDYIFVSESENNNSRISKLVLSTKGQVLHETKDESLDNSNNNYSNKNNTKLDNLEDLEPATTSLKLNNKRLSLNLENNDNQKWTKEIKKSELLKFLKKNEISLSSLSKLSIIKDDNGNVEKLSIGGKVFNFSDLAYEFDLKSNNITNIYKTKSSIIIEGIGNKKDNSFNVKTADTMAKSGKNYTEIINHQLNGYSF